MLRYDYCKLQDGHYYCHICCRYWDIFKRFYNTVKHNSVPDSLSGPGLYNPSQHNPPPNPQLHPRGQWPTCHPSKQTDICPHFPHSALSGEAVLLLLSARKFCCVSDTTVRIAGKTCRSSNDNHCVSYWHNPFLCFKMHCLVKRLLITGWGWERVLTPFLSIFGLCWWCPSIDKFLMHVCL